MQSIEFFLKRNRVALLLFIKKILSNFLKFIQSDSEFVQWVEILNDISDKSKNVLLGCVYIPPEFSPYSSDEAFLQLEDELITHSNFSKNVALIRDFNSRTSIGSDFVIPDENLLEILQVDDDISQENIFTYLILEKKKFLCKGTVVIKVESINMVIFY